MTTPGPNRPPQNGFRWVEAPHTAPSPANRRRRRILFAALAFALIAVLVAGGVLTWRALHGTDKHIDAVIGSPQDSLVSFPLSRKPVPGWRLSAAEIGLPDGVGVGTLFAGIEDKAYFLSDRTDPAGASSSGWVYGVDTKSGKPLFPPVELPGFRGYPLGECYGNGPGVAVCLTDANPTGGTPQTVWVVDLAQGRVTFTGETDLHLQGDSGADKYSVFAIGSHPGETRLVAAREGEGVYGIGPKAERTWFVPGGGEIFDPGYREPTGVPAPTIASQNASPDTPDAPYRVFSVIDGKDLTPSPPEGTAIRKSLVYNGGFAYSFQEAGHHDGLLFYDTDGHPVGRYQDESDDLTAVDNAVMPMARLRSDPAKWLVLSASGALVQSLAAPDADVTFKIVGTRLFISQPGTEDRWQQWDLTSGTAGPVCALNLGYDYIGSDGSIIITGGGLTSSTVTAVDPSTCQTVWQIDPEQPDGSMHLWQVGTGLIQATRDEVTALTAG